MALDVRLSFVTCPTAWIDHRRTEGYSVRHNAITPIDEMVPLEIFVDIELDNIYDNAIKNGALGGKLLGAGGGGFFLFFVEPEKRFSLIKHLKSSGLILTNFRFEPDGLQGWKVRIPSQ